MKVYILHLDEDTQVCSTMDKAIEAAKEAFNKWPGKVEIDNIESHDDMTIINYTWDSTHKHFAWIYPYIIDGGPVC